MNVLFVHNNFPAQYRHLAHMFARTPNVKVAAVGARSARGHPGVDLRRYSTPEEHTTESHPFARRFDMECRRAEQVLYALTSLKSSGFVPDIIFAHPGWGETLPLRTIFPSSQIVLYCEFFYRRHGQDVGFDPEFSDVGADGLVNLYLKNAATLLALAECDAGVSPTRWQRMTYPNEYLPRISVIHDGIDTSVFRPNAKAMFRLPSGRVLTAADEVVTFVARNLEPLRGYHVFMRALPKLLKARPKAEVLVIGGNGTSYGRLPPRGNTWRSLFFSEIEKDVDVNRVHFTDALPHRDYLLALQISAAHVYLTYPFVLSWSLLEAMSTGCVVVGSDTEPVREVIVDNENGFLAPFFDAEAIADKLIECLAKKGQLRSLRSTARLAVVRDYDLDTVSIPAFQAFVKERLGLSTMEPQAGAVSGYHRDN
jgi:glycosyltransferase involved in cell wall biosynthesis